MLLLLALLLLYLLLLLHLLLLCHCHVVVGRRWIVPSTTSTPLEYPTSTHVIARHVSARPHPVARPVALLLLVAMLVTRHVLLLWHWHPTRWGVGLVGVTRSGLACGAAGHVLLTCLHHVARHPLLVLRLVHLLVGYAHLHGQLLAHLRPDSPRLPWLSHHPSLCLGSQAAWMASGCVLTGTLGVLVVSPWPRAKPPWMLLPHLTRAPHGRRDHGQVL